MILLLVLCYNAYCGCDHDKFQHLFDWNATTEPSTESKRKLRSAEYKPIRITMDYGFIDGSKEDPMMCKRGVPSVTWGRTRYTCDSADILNDTQINAIKGTMDNVKDFFERLFKVDPVVGGFTLRTTSDAPGIAAGTKVENTDLHITVIVRPFGGSSPVAQAGPINSEAGSMRALQGLVYLNPRHVPQQPQSENSRNSMYFNVIIHEIFHVLGITNQRYSYYHPKGSNSYYKDPVCELKKNGKHFSILTTPHAHKQAVRMYGDEEWIGDDGKVCKSGIIIEDQGGQGTALSHPEAIIYYNDLMVGMTLQGDDGPFSRLTDVSLAFLLDTGNFEVNWSLAQPLIYGNKDAIDGKKIQGWPLSPPMSTFPDYFYDTSKPQVSVGFEYNWWSSGTSLVRIPCPNGGEYAMYCNAQKYYNPNNLDYAGNVGPFDFQPIIMPSMVCPEGKATIPGLTYYSNDECAKYECNGYDNFTLYLVTQIDINKVEKFTCTAKGQKISYTRRLNRYRYYPAREITCPSPEQFCRTRKMLNEHFTFDPFSDAPSTDASTNNPSASTIPGSETETPEDEPQTVPPTMTPVPERTPSPTQSMKPTPSTDPWWWGWWPWFNSNEKWDSQSYATQRSAPVGHEPSPSSASKSNLLKNGLIVGGVAFVVIIVIGSAIIIYRYRKNHNSDGSDSSNETALEETNTQV